MKVGFEVSTHPNLLFSPSFPAQVHAVELEADEKHGECCVGVGWKGQTQESDQR